MEKTFTGSHSQPPQIQIPNFRIWISDFPKLSTINPSSLARTFEAKRKEDKVSPRCSYNRQNVGFPKKVSNMDAKYYINISWQSVCFCAENFVDI